MLKKLMGRLEPYRSGAYFVVFLSVVAMVAAYVWRVGDITPGKSAAEAANLSASHSLHALYASPFFAPHNIFQYILIKLHHPALVWARLVSVLWGLLFIACFYKVARSWFGSFVGWLSPLLFAATPLVMLAARSATGDIMYLAPLGLAAIYFWLSRAEEISRKAYFSLFLALAVSLYSPGAIWLIALGVFCIRSSLRPLLSSRGNLMWLGFGLSLVLVAPLIAAFAREPDLIKPWLLIPASWHPLTFLKAIGWMASGLVWQTGSHSDLQVGRFGALGSAQLVLAGIGSFALWQRARLKTYGLIVVVLLGILGAGLNGSYSLLLPALCAASLFVAAGLRYLNIEWQGVFPRNPLPRNFALLLLCSAVAFSLFYGVRYSLVAWPHQVATRQTYMLK